MEKQLGSDYKLRLDANEMNIDPSTFSLDWSIIKAFNRYPDTSSEKLRIALAKELNQNRIDDNFLKEHLLINPKQLIIGTGSDEILKLILEGLMIKGGGVIAPHPSFYEYEKLTGLVQGQFIKVAGKNLNVDIEAIIQMQKQTKASVIFIVNPNNPTGQLIPKEEIEQLLLRTNAWIVIDEAYGEFSGETAVELLEKYKKLLITRTLSKAYGLASLRIGYLIAQEEIACKLRAYKMTYNISGVSQAIALEVLKNTEYSRRYVAEIKKLRKYAEEKFSQMTQIEMIPSKANFILIRMENNGLYLSLKEAFEIARIKVRYFQEEPLRSCIRITLTNRKEFDYALKVINRLVK